MSFLGINDRLCKSERTNGIQWIAAVCLGSVAPQAIHALCVALKSP